MKSLSQIVQNTPASGIRRFFDLVAELDDVISLGVGEPDYVTPWRIREAAIYSLEKGRTTYTSNYGLLELREAIVAKHIERYKTTWNPRTEVLVTVGVSEALDTAFRAILNPGDEVILFEPFYGYHLNMIISVGAVARYVTTTPPDWSFSMDALEAVITPKTRAIVVCTPSNPSGKVYTQQEIEAIGAIATKHDLLIFLLPASQL